MDEIKKKPPTNTISNNSRNNKQTNIVFTDSSQDEQEILAMLEELGDDNSMKSKSEVNSIKEDSGSMVMIDDLTDENSIMTISKIKNNVAIVKYDDNDLIVFLREPFTPQQYTNQTIKNNLTQILKTSPNLRIDKMILEYTLEGIKHEYSNYRTNRKLLLMIKSFSIAFEGKAHLELVDVDGEIINATINTHDFQSKNTRIKLHYGMFLLIGSDCCLLAFDDGDDGRGLLEPSSPDPKIVYDNLSFHLVISKECIEKIFVNIHSIS